MSFDASAWNKAKVDDNGGSEAPDPGSYEVALDDADFFVSKAGNDIIKLSLRVTHGGGAEGHAWDEIRGMATDGQMKAAKATCARLGIDVDTITSGDELKAELQACVGRYYAIEVKQNGQYRNTYINDRIGAGATSDLPGAVAQPTAAAVGSDDDVPF